MRTANVIGKWNQGVSMDQLVTRLYDQQITQQVVDDQTRRLATENNVQGIGVNQQETDVMNRLHQATFLKPRTWEERDLELLAEKAALEKETATNEKRLKKWDRERNVETAEDFLESLEQVKLYED